MALINPCSFSNTGSNTGYECGKALSELAGVILVPPTASWSLSDMDDFAGYIETKTHAAKASRWFPIFADLKNIEISNESDTEESFPDGTKDLVRLGGYNLMLHFKEGGECLAQALLSFNKLNYRFILVDKDSQFKVRANADGTYSGLKASDIHGAAPQMKTFGQSFMNKLSINISVEEFIENAEIFQNDSDLTELTGLIDATMYSAAAASSTKIKLGVKTSCAETDLVALLGSAWGDTDLFTLYNVTDAAAVVVSAAAVVNGMIELSYTSQTSADVIRVTAAVPSVMLANNVSGYEIPATINITIP